jgi:hypothetical protein
VDQRVQLSLLLRLRELVEAGAPSASKMLSVCGQSAAVLNTPTALYLN